jgi:hypothetical protein
MQRAGFSFGKSESKDETISEESNLASPVTAKVSIFAKDPKMILEKIGGSSTNDSK